MRGAGNTGVSALSDVLGRAASVTTQASAKNVLAVGSSRLSRTAMQEATGTSLCVITSSFVTYL